MLECKTTFDIPLGYKKDYLSEQFRSRYRIARDEVQVSYIGDEMMDIIRKRAMDQLIEKRDQFLLDLILLGVDAFAETDMSIDIQDATDYNEYVLRLAYDLVPLRKLPNGRYITWTPTDYVEAIKPSDEWINKPIRITRLPTLDQLKAQWSDRYPEWQKQFGRSDIHEVHVADLFRRS